MMNGECRMQNENTRRRVRARAPHSAFCIHRSAFSLTEVMFAVIVLGIGFIMIAAIFPVSISQSRMTVEETAAAGAARGALAQSTIIAAGGDNPPTGPLLPETTQYIVPPAQAANGGASFTIGAGR